MSFILTKSTKDSDTFTRIVSGVIEDEGYVLSLARYINLNPVKANLVKFAGTYRCTYCLAINQNLFEKRECYMKKTVFVGDSLTEGIPGVSYWRYLHHKSSKINKGVGGDTLLGASKRIKSMLNNKRYDVVDTYILEIGTNDVLLQTLSQHSFCWKIVAFLKGRLLGAVPCSSIEMFEEKYEELLRILSQNRKKVGIIGLPIIENSILKINDVMGEYEQVIRLLAEKNDIPYVNLRVLEEELKGTDKGTYFFGKTILGNMLDTIFTSILPFSRVVSKIRGLTVTIDSTHLNSRTAMNLANLIEQEFKSLL